MSRSAKFFPFVTWAAVAAAQPADVDLDKAVGSLIAAEKAYAKLASEKGFREASIATFAEDAVIFAPDAVNGKKFWQESKQDPVISWRPSFASMARSGELGYTTGPAEFWKSRAQKPEGFGHFVSIWRKDSKGVWKVVLDIGVDHPSPSQADSETSVYVPNKPQAHPESASADLDKAQRDLAESLKDNEADAIIDRATDDIRIYRHGRLPAVGKDAAKKMLGDEDAKTTRMPLGAGTSHPVDLAYEYGQYASELDETTQRGIYVCIWRLESDGTWKIALDFQKSAPAEKP